MLRTCTIACSLVLVGSFAAAARRSAQGEPQMPQPTEEHRLMLQGAGEWEGTLTHWMSGTEATEPCKESREAFGPFWMLSTFECEFMGMPYRGHGATGYDAQKKKYVGTWLDNMSSYLAVMEGEMDQQGKLVMRWMAHDMESGKIVPNRFEAVADQNSYTSTFFMGEGAGKKTMVISMKRKGASSAK
jgi:hypothetical protein